MLQLPNIFLCFTLHIKNRHTYIVIVTHSKVKCKSAIHKGHPYYDDVLGVSSYHSRNAPCSYQLIS
ncbi:MAG: hypothetical protein NVS4B7_08830 [Ktedonobacteraceae bacterium]